MSQNELSEEMKEMGFKPYSAYGNSGCYSILTNMTIDVKPSFTTVDYLGSQRLVWRICLMDAFSSIRMEPNFPTFEQAQDAALVIAKAIKEVDSFIQEDPI